MKMRCLGRNKGTEIKGKPLQRPTLKVPGISKVLGLKD
jgi:hypothetical protein